ncbi:MAG: UvrD-helicase domain-containing protein [Acidobacteriota bacterium]
MTPAAPDLERRERALQATGSFILDAPAGSGKTALLTARFLALLAEVAHPRQILAVTFTRKAAAEMTTRITQTLKAARKGTPLDGDNPWNDRLLCLARNALDAHPERAALLESPDAFLVSTFHGFCASLLRAWPLEAGLPPGLDLLDELSQEALLEEVLDALVTPLSSGKERGPVAEAFTRRLAAADNNLSALRGQLKSLLERRDRLVPLGAYLAGPGAPEEMERRLAAFADHLLAPLSSFFQNHAAQWEGIVRSLQGGQSPEAGAMPFAVPGSGLKDLASWKAAAEVLVTGTGTPRKIFPRSLFPPGFNKTEEGLFLQNLPPEKAKDLAFVKKWPDPAGDNVGREALTDMLLLAGEALERLAGAMRRRGVDFQELELAALRALNHSDRPGESLIFYHEHLQHMLVDEAQDMNDTQLNILSALASGWEPGDGRTLFVVGDPKQSIYRFRRAEVSLFEGLKKRGLTRSGEADLRLENLRLEANFRSRPHLLKFSNEVFGRLMANPDRAYDEVDFVPAKAVREPLSEPPGTTIALFSYKNGRSGEESRTRGEAGMLEARYVAARTALLHRSFPDRTLGILIPDRTRLSLFVGAFDELGVPLRITEGIPMLDRPEVRHLLALFTAMVRPYDDLAWAGALRSPWCRVGNRVLKSLADSSPEIPWRERILNGGEIDPEVERFGRAVRNSVPDMGRERYDFSLQHLWEILGGPESVASQYRESGVANCLAFFETLRRCSGLPAEDAVLRLGRELSAAFTPPDPRGAFSKVSLMTVHKAKGLEFDHVFAVNLDRKVRRRGGLKLPPFLMDCIPGTSRKLLVASAKDRRTRKESLAGFLLSELDFRRQRAEALRRFYVAATRAREGLTLTGLLPFNKQGPSTGGNHPSPAAFLYELDRDGIFEGLSAAAVLDPEIPRVPVRPPAFAEETGAVVPFDPEPVPYEISSPSRLAEETAVPVRPGEEEQDPDARVRGVVLHRLLETLARDGALPGAGPVASALGAEGVDLSRAEDLAADLLEEARRVWELPELVEARRKAVQVRPEWGLEDHDGGKRLRVGRVDLFLRLEEEAFLVDFKTGRPSSDSGRWIADEIKKYHPQLKAYKEMTHRLTGMPETRIRAVLIFTSLPQWVELQPGGWNS